MATLLTVNDSTPDVADSAFIASTAVVAGKVTLGAKASVWYGCVLRAEIEPITIGASSNIQDLSVIHTDPGSPVVIGDRVTVGHRVVLHGCTIEDDVLVGMGAVVMNDAVIGAGAVVAAGAVVTSGTQIPPDTLAAGIPAKPMERRVPDVPRLNVAAYEYLSELYRAAEG